VQSIVLLTDGLQTHGESAETVLPDLVRTLTRVYTVGIGPEIDDPLLQDLAERTGGEFVRVDPNLPDDEQAFAMRLALERFAVHARDGGDVAGGSPERMTDGQRITRSSVVETGARSVTFVLSWPDAKDRIDLEVIGPDGPAAGHLIQPRRPYVAVRVTDPAPGRWRMRMTCHTERAEARLQSWIVLRARGDGEGDDRGVLDRAAPVGPTTYPAARTQWGPRAPAVDSSRARRDTCPTAPTWVRLPRSSLSVTRSSRGGSSTRTPPGCRTS
jgi:hypothetical protein